MNDNQIAAYCEAIRDTLIKQFYKIQNQRKEISMLHKKVAHQQAEIESLKRKLNHSIGVDNTKENGYFPLD